jgi:L-ascorbate metabolism protein UlaG (beta-lactamase superfamily)
MKVTWFGHSAFRVEFADSVILIDPFLSGNPKFEGSVEKAAEGCTHVVLTHGHDDHIGDTVDICKATGATLIAVYELAVHLHEKGVEKFDPTNTGGAVYHKDFMCTFVRADHSSSSGGVLPGQSVRRGHSPACRWQPCSLSHGGHGYLWRHGSDRASL